MRKELKSPYKNYVGYKIFHKKEGRFYLCLVHKTKKKRKTISYARYKMSVKLGRRLKKWEEVDHVDENKRNDKLKNLQVLTKQENLRKHRKFTGIKKKFKKLNCPVCGCKFKRERRQVITKIRNGKQPTCSRKCGGIFSHKGR